MNKQNKIFSGLLFLIIGLIIAILAIDYLSKPDNFPISFKPIESLKTYFFSFVFTMGGFGWILGNLILAIYSSAFYILGTRIYKLVSKNETEGN